MVESKAAAGRGLAPAETSGDHRQQTAWCATLDKLALDTALTPHSAIVAQYQVQKEMS